MKRKMFLAFILTSLCITTATPQGKTVTDILLKRNVLVEGAILAACAGGAVYFGMLSNTLKQKFQFLEKLKKQLKKNHITNKRILTVEDLMKPEIIKLLKDTKQYDLLKVLLTNYTNTYFLSILFPNLQDKITFFQVAFWICTILGAGIIGKNIYLFFNKKNKPPLKKNTNQKTISTQTTKIQQICDQCHNKYTNNILNQFPILNPKGVSPENLKPDNYNNSHPTTDLQTGNNGKKYYLI